MLARHLEPRDPLTVVVVFGFIAAMIGIDLFRNWWRKRHPPRK